MNICGITTKPEASLKNERSISNYIGGKIPENEENIIYKRDQRIISFSLFLYRKKCYKCNCEKMKIYRMAGFRKIMKFFIRICLIKDHMTSTKAAEHYFETISCAYEHEIIIYPGCAHFPQFEEKEKFYEWLTAKISSL